MTAPRITAELIDHYRHEAARLRADAFRAAVLALWRAATGKRRPAVPQAAAAAWR